jgi:hypothetical protein
MAAFEARFNVGAFWNLRQRLHEQPRGQGEEGKGSLAVGAPGTRHGLHPSGLRHGENASGPTDPEPRLRALFRWTSRDTVPTLWSPRENETSRNEESELRSGAEWPISRLSLPVSENRPGRRVPARVRLYRSETDITRGRFNLDFPHSATRVVSTYHVDGAWHPSTRLHLAPDALHVYFRLCI